ncbi:hypothetical protein LZ198_28425 [Myxococcus sp. K15C18031901]|uniref:hypothetical protein n=1 Tax=Myxococcus dinghuensis TaxID=2906761 RepID=UPI0020A7F7B0|nr:hypothetical protein [Myxococcus dinghuensis]MCP3102809.1 hypothetical protein [Myxococcus dinghuensis]
MGAVVGLLFAVGFGAVAQAEESEARDVEPVACAEEVDAMAADPQKACYRQCVKQGAECVYACIQDGSPHECYDACGIELQWCMVGCSLTDATEQQ